MKRFLCIAFCTISLAALAQLDPIVEKLETRPQTEETAIWLCDTAFSIHRNDPLLAQQIADLAKEKAIKWGADLALAKANHVIGVTFWIRDEYEEALAYYLEALKYYTLSDNTRGMAIINMNIGIIYDDLNQTERSKGYYLKSEQQIRELGDSINLGRILNNMAVAMRRTGKLDSSLMYFKECLELRKALGDSADIATTYNNIANVYLEKDSDIRNADASLAYDNLVLALDYVDIQNRTYFVSKANMGKALTVLGRYAEAEKILLEVLSESKANDYPIIEQWSNDYLSRLYERKGDYEKALEYQKREVEIENELRSAEVNKQIDELNIKYETAKKEKKVAELERQSAIERGIRNMLVVGVAATLLVAIIIVFYILMKRRKDRLISKLQLQKLNDQITSKNKEIASYTMSFLQKNQLMEELKEQINELKKSSDVSTNKELTRINRIVDNTFRSDEEWKTFQITFDQMHDGFFKDLKQAFPDISNAELKLCALLRLNMNLKESAKILGIAADSVKTARYRLRKKLGLKTEDNLVDFLIQFEKQEET